MWDLDQGDLIGGSLVLCRNALLLTLLPSINVIPPGLRTTGLGG